MCFMMLRVVSIFIFYFSFKSAFSKEIPIIVISASKKPQSLSDSRYSVTIT